MLANAPPAWNNEPLRLYHGTLESAVALVMAGVELAYCQPLRDFGRGFYLTTLQRQAESWARSRADRLGWTDQPAVIRFEVGLQRLCTLESLSFVRSEWEAAELWSLIWRCRQSDTDHGRPTNGGWYDLVVGPLSMDWQQRIAAVNSDQFGFHTPAAIQLLNSSPRSRVS